MSGGVDPCLNCGAKAGIACVDDRCCNRDERRALLQLTDIRLTDLEQAVVDRLARAWNAYLELRRQDLGGDDDLNDFRQGIHQLQRIIMSRVARRANPEVFR